ncbi:MAG: autotransporter outer membrane beta-barrel domain-containing protein [Verrucomicrobiales bacterium]|jgi:outer membrane autotransporter protein|nr:autotransporter outer membrane beta-barrel domain-containing protein [Verrucomicrobiales bacterium]
MNPKLKPLILLCTLSAAALNVLAANKVVDGITETESDAAYQATTTEAALWVTDQGAYTGTAITLSGSNGNPNSASRGGYGAYVDGTARLNLHSSTVTITSNNWEWQNNKAAVIGTDRATVSLTDVQLNAVGAHKEYLFGLQLTGSAVGQVQNVTVNLTKTYSERDLAGFGVNLSDGATLTGTSLTINASGTYRARGMWVGNATYDLTDVTITVHGEESQGLFAAANSSGTIRNLNIKTAAAPALMLEGDNVFVAVIGGTLHSNSSAGVQFNGADTGQIERASLTDVDIITKRYGVFMRAPDAALEMNGGSITLTDTTGTSAKILSTEGTDHQITLNHVSMQDDGSDAIIASGNATVNVAANDTDLYGNVNNYSTGELKLNLNHSTLSGTVTPSGTSDTVINLDDSTITGDLTAIENATLTVSGSNGATITGAVSGNDNASIDVSVSGTGSTLLGDIAQSGSSAVTVILNDRATGKGGYNGGNLITNSDSVWNFNKDSHGNYGDNHGTWNIGDYEVIFDNMTHTGTVNISVNSDTGEGGSITVTGTADGEGTVHINTTGNGKADPNKVLPGIVSGDGTDNWQWDPINWGIDTVIKDGDHFIKQGTSPAGAVLNSSVAIQQAMWFAQQNSLLKRMGELRYGARASRPLADKDVRVPYHSLIENIWLRSYGQQLNIGSQVAGKAYEQLIYGVDLGTDHKFTISADSDLYLGVYAGYGRSDLDYRTPGTDGEINSYYGGLYATWLHSSGFYLDATVKAASVNNNLKAPYGTTQLTANYSDVNIGGSIEIGKKFTFQDNWFIEPQFQVNYLHILAEDYTASPMNITVSDLDALQLRLGSLFGRTINLTNSGVLQPYVKISGVETISTGGTLHNGYQHTRANTDGARAELGAGLIWQLDTNNQLHLDYEASFGDKYDKPWGLSAGYRHQF